MHRRSLAFKLILGGILIMAVPLAIVGTWSTIRSSRTVQEITSNSLISVAKSLASTVDVLFEEEMKIAEELSVGNTTIAVATKVAEVGVEAAKSEIEQLDSKLIHAMKQIGKGYEGIFVCDTSGNIYSDGVQGGFKGISIQDREYFKKSLQTGKPFIGKAVKSKKSGKPVVPIAAPIFSPKAQLVGILCLVAKTDLLAEKVLSVKIGKTGYAVLVDYTGAMVVHPDEKQVLEMNILKIPEMKDAAEKMLSGKSGLGEYVFKGSLKLTGYAPVPSCGFAVATTIPVDEFLAESRSLQTALLATSFVCILIAAAGIFWFSRSITKPIYRFISSLNEGAEQVTSAASQVSEASQTLAEGSSEQAAAIEETSSSLEEMAAMTKQNASNSGQANAMMIEATNVIKSAGESMNRLIVAMKDMTAASEETSKIIKTIDEIAFQTNLLALNAAVEAARAGEAGAGFAVVADEVRNLARRAAEAARQTSDLIEETIKKVNEGSSLVNKTSVEFVKVSDSTLKVGELLSEISTASNEQAEGIQQLTSAVAQMDQVTQQNASTAEESASAAEELNAQAVEMKHMVEEIFAIIAGSTNKPAALQVATPPKTPVTKRRTSRLPVRKTGQQVTASGSREVSPENLIPFDDDDLKSF